MLKPYLTKPASTFHMKKTKPALSNRQTWHSNRQTVISRTEPRYHAPSRDITHDIAARCVTLRLGAWYRGSVRGNSFHWCPSFQTNTILVHHLHGCCYRFHLLRWNCLIAIVITRGEINREYWINNRSRRTAISRTEPRYHAPNRNIMPLGFGGFQPLSLRIRDIMGRNSYARNRDNVPRYHALSLPIPSSSLEPPKLHSNH